MTHHFTTTLTLPDEAEVEIEVSYIYHRGYPATLIDPPEPASVEIQSVVPDVPESLWDELAEEAFQHHADYCNDAAEYRYESRRDYD